MLTGQHKSVEFSCMEVGHTKFHPDWHFGLWKVSTCVFFTVQLRQMKRFILQINSIQHLFHFCLDPSQFS